MIFVARSCSNGRAGADAVPRHAAGAPAPAQGYGVDPKMDNYMAPWPGLLSKAQLAKIASLAGLVLSPDDHALESYQPVAGPLQTELEARMQKLGL